MEKNFTIGLYHDIRTKLQSKNDKLINILNIKYKPKNE